MKIIDIHGHLGDILYPHGGDLISKTGIKFPVSFWEWFLCERVLYKETFFFRTAEKLAPYWSVKAERKRNFSATLENLRKSLDGTNIVKCVCAPVAPNVTYGDIRSAAEAEPRIIAFTSPDFTSGINNMKEKLKSDVQNGAMGVKIHPIIQDVGADSDIVFEAVEVLQSCGCEKPVLLHTGPARYYLPAENKISSIDYASIERVERLVSAFPNVNFIVGHAGLDDFRKTIGIMPKYKNTYVDTSFQYPEAIRALIKALGDERVMFASDWHYGLRKPAIRTVMEACGDDTALQHRIFYQNAADLLKII